MFNQKRINTCSDKCFHLVVRSYYFAFSLSQAEAARDECGLIAWAVQFV
jgi:hypothetical protein